MRGRRLWDVEKSPTESYPGADLSIFRIRSVCGLRRLADICERQSDGMTLRGAPGGEDETISIQRPLQKKR